MKHRKLLIILLILASAAAVYFAVRGNESSPATKQSAVPGKARATLTELRYPSDSPQLAYLEIKPILALPEPLLEPLNARVAYDDNYTARVTSPVAGRIVKIGVQPGDAVRAGQPLVWLDSPEYGGAVADVAKSDADLHQKQGAFNRAKTLFDGDVLARKDFESAQADLRQAEAENKRTRLRLANLTRGKDGGGDNEKYVLRAPIAGIVAETRANPGAEVRPDAADPLFVITNPAHLWVIIDLPEKYLNKVSVGQKVLVDVDAYPGGDFTGHVASIGAVLDPATRRVQVRCVVDNPSLLLKPEMYARVTLVADEQHKLPRIPNSAIITQGLYSFIFIEKELGVFEKRRIVLGLQGRGESYVKAGLGENERVVTRGALLLNSELAGND